MKQENKRIIFLKIYAVKGEDPSGNWQETPHIPENLTWHKKYLITSNVDITTIMNTPWSDIRLIALGDETEVLTDKDFITPEEVKGIFDEVVVKLVNSNIRDGMYEVDIVDKDGNIID